MKITGYRRLRTVHRWGRPIGDANGVVRSGVTTVPIVLLDTDGGLTGVGLGDNGDIDLLFGALEGEDPRAVSSLYDAMLGRVFKAGHNGRIFATVGALDTALWDLKAKMAGEPLWRLLGARDRVVTGYASGLDIGLDGEELAAVYREFAGRGLTAAKLKGGLDVEEDIARLGIVADALRSGSTVGSGASKPALMIDVNETWTVKQAVRYVRRLEEHHDLSWVEEPVRRFDAAGLAAVSRGVATAVASGENLTGLEQYLPLLSAGAPDVVQVAGCWGITHFLRVAAAAHLHGLPVSPVTYHGNPLAHAAAALPNHLVSEIQHLHDPVGLTIDHTVQDGAIILGDEPGLGIAVDEKALAAGFDASEGSGWADAAGPHVRPPGMGRFESRRPAGA